MRILKNPDGPAYDLQFSPDSRWLMTRRSGVCLAPMPGGDLKKVPGTGTSRGAALTPSSLLVLSGDELFECDLTTGERLTARPLGEAVGSRCLNFSSQAGFVAAIGGRTRAISRLAISRWAWPCLEARPSFPIEREGAHWNTQLKLSPDGRWAALRHYRDQTVELLDLTTGKRCWDATPPGLVGWTNFAFSPDNRRLALGSGRHLTLMAVADGRTLASAQLEKKYFRGLAFTPDGQYLAAVSHEETVKAYDATTLRLRHEMAWGIGKLECVAFSPDGMLGAATGGKKAVLWDVDW
jgi:WD40 repeat protein